MGKTPFSLSNFLRNCDFLYQFPQLNMYSILALRAVMFSLQDCAHALYAISYGFKMARDRLLCYWNFGVVCKTRAHRKPRNYVICSKKLQQVTVCTFLWWKMWEIICNCTFLMKKSALFPPTIFWVCVGLRRRSSTSLHCTQFSKFADGTVGSVGVGHLSSSLTRKFVMSARLIFDLKVNMFYVMYYSSN